MFAVPSHEQLVGRDSEIARLKDVATALAAGRGTVVEIAGDPGIGKTSLLGALAAQADRVGAHVLRAHAVRGAEIPYQVFRDVWRDRPGIDAVGDGLDGDLHGDREGGPESDPFPGSAPILPTHPRFRLGLAVRTSLGDWAAGHGGVLILDDLHWCDEESEKLTAQLIRTPVPGPFVLAVAHRPRQTRSLLLEALDHGAQTGTVVRVEPEPLAADGVAALLGGLRKGGGVPTVPHSARASNRRAEPAGSYQDFEARRYVERLTAASGGNPRNLRILVAGGWQADSWPDRAGTDRDALLREAATVTAELDALTPDASKVVGAAAVLGEPFRPEDVAVVSGLGLNRTLDALAELARGDLMRALASGGRFGFRHRVLGHVAHERTDPSFRLAAHRRALGRLSARGASAEARARHAEHVVGTDGALALQVLAEGAAEAITENPATAARWLRLVLDTLPGGDRLNPPRATLMLSCCRALSAAGRLEEARALAHELLNDQSSLPADLRLEAHAACADVERLLGRYDEAEAMAHAALEGLPRPLPAPLPAGTAELTFEYGLVHALRGTYRQARTLVREVAGGADGARDVTQLGLQVLSAFGDTYIGEMDTAIPEVTACARLVDGLPDAAAARIPEALAMVGCAEIYLERFADAYRHLRRGLKITSGGAQQHIVTHHLLGLSILDQWTGRLERAQRWGLEAERHARAIGAEDAVGFAMTTRATALMWARTRRDSAEIVALAEEGTRHTSLGPGWWAGAAAAQLAQIRLMSGDAEGCVRTLTAEGGGDGLPLVQPQFRPETMALLSMAALRCGDRDTARRSVEDAEAAAERLGLSVQWANARRARAALHLTDGEHDAAAKLFDESAESFRRAGMPVQHAWTLVTGARSAEAAKGQGTALSWLESAVNVSRSCGAVRVGEEAVRVRGEMMAAVSGTALSAAGPGQLSLLTGREWEIAELAAAGKRSREIADQLFLSPRTVEAHLARIYRKLEVPSRAALATALLRMPSRMPNVADR